MPADHATVDQAARLVMMANQIAKEFAIQGEARAVPQIADHIRSFWTPVMRATLARHAAGHASDLHPLVTRALPSIA